VNLVVIGLGNDDRGDDAVGLEVARRVGGHAHVGDLADLALAWGPGDRVVIVDAVEAAAPSGTVGRLRPEDVAGGRAPTSTHGLGLPAALALARALGRVPASVEVVGIVGRAFGVGAPMSAAVADARDRVVVWLAAGGGTSWPDEGRTALVGTGPEAVE